jgi:hypothetical protein
MADKRGEKRHRKRFKLRYGVDEATTMAFTEDISEEGLFIKTGVVQPSNTLLTVELTTPDDELILLEGTVQWTKSVSPAMLRAGKKGGMGIKITRFLAGEKIFRDIHESLRTET